ncbi:T9SS type A sorting domain-containing protein [Candidatus Eisenbacteria bacterium]|uniref:T9SS type A sorting domain-containing protein n=1 Tax=Eiseniibacteriota bacterium TaxID=2212470 RepID=A0ABV6YIZ8_UNCEI
MRWALLLFSLLLLLPVTVGARTWHILPDGSGDEPTIQAGIDAAAHHDTILVAPGTYFEKIDFEGKKVTVGSHFMTTGDTSWISQTVIDGQGTYGSVATFENSEESLSILCGLTLTGGFGTAYGYVLGAGIFINGASPTLLHLIIRENGSTLSDLIGGGIAVRQGSPFIDHVRIENNEAGYYCGGFACLGSDSRPILRNSVIAGNWGDGSTAVDIDAGAHATLENVSITGNLSSTAFASILCLSHSRLDLINVTVTGNDGLYMDLSSGATIVLVNSILWSNNTPEVYFSEYGGTNTLIVSHCTIAGGLEGIETNGQGTVEWLDGNLEDDPQFLNAGEGDYGLAPGSPCIDAGTPHFVWDDEILIDLGPEDYCGDAPDMGALEYCPDPAAIRESWMLPRSVLRVYPNPSTAWATASFTLDRPQSVTISIFDLGGRLVSCLIAGSLRPGVHSIRWDGNDVTGRPVESGTYFYRLNVNGESVSKRVLLAR